MQLSHREFIRQYKQEQQKKKRCLRRALILLAVCFLLSLCFRTVYPGFIPKYTAINLYEALKLNLAHLIGSSYYLDRQSIILSLEYYGETVNRLVISLFTAISGMALGLAGAAFQHVYKNPIASPSTIGVTAGVNLGNMLLVILFASSALSMVLYRYLLCLVCSGGVIAAVLVAGKIMGRGGKYYSVVEMLMLGSIVSRMITSLNTYLMYHLSGSAFLAYQRLNLGVYQAFTYKSLVIFLIVMAVGIVPLLRMRFRINAAGIDPAEAGAAGVRVWVEQLIIQSLSTLVVAAACIQCGDVGLFALVIPHVLRYAVGADFRSLAVYSCVFGGIFLLVIRMVSSMFFLGAEPIPLNFIVSIVMIPAFLIMLAMQRRGFD